MYLYLLILIITKAGRLEAVEFLLEHTSARQRLAPVDGDRSLLHVAAKTGKVTFNLKIIH